MTLKIVKKLTKQKYDLKSEMMIFFFIIVFTICTGFPTETENVCRTLECNKTASRVLDYMDSTENPCDNFYKFACGNFLNNTKIPDDKGGVDIFSVLTDKVFEQLNTVIKEKISPHMPKRLQFVKTFYDICMNETAIKEHGLNPLKDKFKKLGGWPVLEESNWNEDTFNWTNSVYILRELGYSYNYLLGLEVGTDLKNNTKVTITLKFPELALGSSLITKGLKDNIVKGYQKFMTDIAVLLGAKPENAQKELTESLLFEMALSNISLSNNVPLNESYNPLTVKELEEKYPRIPWLEYFNNIFQPHVNIDKNQTIFVSCPKCLSEFEKLMNTTSKRIQANYILWRVCVDSVPFLNDEIREPQMEFTTTVTGRTKKPLRVKKCIDNISTYMSLSLGALYVKNYFNEDIKNDTNEMVNNIKNQLKITLQTLDWMDKETKKHALEKVNAVINRMAYNDILLDDDKMDEIYKNFELIGQNSYLDTMLNARLFMYNVTFELLKGLFDKNSLGLYISPTVVNAYYFHYHNIIQFPAAILQGIFYNVDRPRYMNYGAIGFLIGHEITHGFDVTGMNFDKNGNWNNWWEPSTAIEFSKKASCLIDQYENYRVKEVKKNISGINTITENIADNGGFKLAYLAYKNWTSLNGVELQLPGLERFSSTQMFWISAAQTWCAVQRPENMKIFLDVDSHSPSEFRIKGSFSNMKEFSDDFKCPLESPMNPKDKCTVW